MSSSSRGAVGRVSDMRSTGRGFQSQLRTQVSQAYVPLSPNSVSWYWPKGGDAW